MNGGIRQSMAWLHTWVGLLLGWLLFLVFVTGTAAYFQDEITRWMQPEVRGQHNIDAGAEGAVAYMQKHAANAEQWSIELPGERAVATTAFWKEKGETFAQWRDHAFLVDGHGQKVDARDTLGGWRLYRMHFDLYYLPVLWARWLVGLAAMFMLVAIISGVITHKKIFADFFTLRFGKGQRSWLDGHNLTAVLALPFHFMITYTGLVTLAAQYMPWGVSAAYENRAAYYADAFGADEAPKRSGSNATMAPIAGMLKQARETWHGAEPGYIFVPIPGDAHGVVKIIRSTGAGMATRGETLTFDAATGVMHARPPAPGAARETESVMIGLHAGRYAPVLLRWFYFLCGLAGTAMVATGLVLWTSKRRMQLPDPERPYFGFRLVERMNIATIAGLPFGIACYFMANRLLPMDVVQRPNWEANWLFIGWGVLCVVAIVRPVKRAWVETLSVAAAGFLAVPVVDMMTTDRGLFVSLWRGDMVFASFDLMMLALAGLLGFCAWKLHNRKDVVRVRRKKEAVA
ncbi:PepSY-associated TM helix domain-containing protein [Luteibacter sp.]|uniref:PepSY-associated TM helix domain-containing protein n=1 Tax=Luteibacter sp. TaxID=1886636 RepID=UPI003F80B934